MKHLLTIAGVIGLTAPAGLCAISVPTVAIYDPGSDANSVDSVAGLGAVTSGSPAETSLNSYKSLFAAAYAANTGGVVQFDGWTAEGGDATPTLNNALSVTFGAGATNSLSITRATGEFQFDSSPTTLGTPISGSMYLRTSGDAFHTMNFGTGLSALGFTVLSRNSSRTIQATVTYFEGGTDVISGEVVAGSSPDDTFFGFTAPAGKTISSLRVEATATGEAGNNFFAIDDFGFVAVPEPSAALLAGLSLSGLLVRRRRA